MLRITSIAFGLSLISTVAFAQEEGPVDVDGVLGRLVSAPQAGGATGGELLHIEGPDGTTWRAVSGQGGLGSNDLGLFRDMNIAVRGQAFAADDGNYIRVADFGPFGDFDFVSGRVGPTGDHILAGPDRNLAVPQHLVERMVGGRDVSGDDPHARWERAGLILPTRAGPAAYFLVNELELPDSVTAAQRDALRAGAPDGHVVRMFQSPGYVRAQPGAALTNSNAHFGVAYVPEGAEWGNRRGEEALSPGRRRTYVPGEIVGTIPADGVVLDARNSGLEQLRVIRMDARAPRPAAQNSTNSRFHTLPEGARRVEGPHRLRSRPRVR